MTKITFGDTDLFRTFGILCETRRDALAPEVAERNIHIPKRNGSYSPSDFYYHDRELELACVTTAELSRAQLRELAYALRGKQRMTLSDEPDKHYLAQLQDLSVISHIGRKGTRHVLRFCCEPFAIGETVTISLVSGENAASCRGTAPTGALLVIRNNGETDVTNIHIRAVTLN